MPHLLDSTREKLARADETSQQLIREIDSFLRANPKPYRIVGELKNDNREYVFTAFGELAIPLRFSVLVGEVMYQLRTGLDHLLAALVTANGGLPTDRHQFPIASTPAKFAEAEKRGDIAGVSTAARNLIEGFQPYQPTQPTPPMLNLLREWNNADKHRLLVVVGGAAALGENIRIQESDGPTSITGMTPPFVKRVTPAGVEVFTIFLGEPHTKFRAHADFVPEVAIPNIGTLESAAVREVVAKMVLFVRGIVHSFEDEFK